jgi:hypothetical protein
LGAAQLRRKGWRLGPPRDPAAGDPAAARPATQRRHGPRPSGGTARGPAAVRPRPSGGTTAAQRRYDPRPNGGTARGPPAARPMAQWRHDRRPSGGTAHGRTARRRAAGLRPCHAALRPRHATAGWIAAGLLRPAPQVAQRRARWLRVPVPSMTGRPRDSVAPIYLGVHIGVQRAKVPAAAKLQATPDASSMRPYAAFDLG